MLTVSSHQVHSFLICAQICLNSVYLQGRSSVEWNSNDAFVRSGLLSLRQEHMEAAIVWIIKDF